MIQLTSKQLEVLPYIEWLFDDSRREGRTTLLAYYFINKAIRIGEWIKPFDHDMPYSYDYNKRSIIPAIKQMFKEYYSKEYEMIWEISTSRFKIRRIE